MHTLLRDAARLDRGALHLRVLPIPTRWRRDVDLVGAAGKAHVQASVGLLLGARERGPPVARQSREALAERERERLAVHELEDEMHALL